MDTVLSSEINQQLNLIRADDGAVLSRFPDFLILGPQRTGSSWLNHHLVNHPRIFLPKCKETYYFSTLGRPDHDKFQFETLEAFLDGPMKDTALRKFRKQWHCRTAYGQTFSPTRIGDATASYATLPPEVIREICLINPDLKAILMLRHPVERVWSHAKKKFTEHTGKALDEIDPEQLDKFFRAGGQLQRSRYRDQIENWTQFLKPGHLLVMDFRLVAESPVQLMRQTLDFLGVPNERFVEKRNLKGQVYATKSIGIPAAIEQRLQELYGEAVADYQHLLTDGAADEATRGCIPSNPASQARRER